MSISSNKDHWENVYKTKSPDEVSWTQDVPHTSLQFIQSFGLPKTANIIDVGGGDSKLADYLLANGYENITVLDISEKALEKAKKRLGEKAVKINWVVSDVTEFKPEKTFDIWHDRAVFHFLVTEEQVAKYIDTVKSAVTAYMVIATFSNNGPKKCSGLNIVQYDEDKLSAKFQNEFLKLNCIVEDHTTPFGTTQNFLFCSFKKP